MVVVVVVAWVVVRWGGGGGGSVGWLWVGVVVGALVSMGSLWRPVSLVLVGRSAVLSVAVGFGWGVGASYFGLLVLA